MAYINRASFEVNGAFSDGDAFGTVEVTLGGETRRVRARLYQGTGVAHLTGTITAYGLTGRYVTGTRAWPAHISQRANGAEHVHFGFDSRSGKHRKASIHFAA